MKDANNDSVKELIPRYLMGDVSDDEKQQLQHWIGLSSENERYYVDARKIFDLGKKHYDEANASVNELDIDVNQEWNQFMATIAAKKETPIKQLHTKPVSPRLWYKIAASILLVAISGFIIYQFLSDPKEFYYQTADNTSTVVLPDGSHVSLNQNSTLKYSLVANERNITFSGEAFFDVAHDREKPFVISIDNARIEVLGTSFNVRAYAHKPVEVVVKTGIVKFSVPEFKSEVKLLAGSKGVYKKTEEKVDSATNSDINFMAWNTRKIIFEEDDLRTVVETLNRVYGVTIVLPATTPASCVVTVTFDHQTLDAVLHVLETTLNLTYTIEGNKIEITATGC